MFVIGITGCLGSGKSTVSEMLSEFGANVISADRVAHQLLFRNGSCFKDVVKEFGSSIVVRNCIVRKKLGAIVFKDASKLKRLEQIMHPELMLF